MKKLTVIFMLLSVIFISGCNKNAEPKITKTIDSGYKTYYEMSDGTWQAEGHSYKYRLEISGRMPAAEKDSTFVYLSNIENISFEQAWKAAGLSSSSTDYFDAGDALLVEME